MADIADVRRRVAQQELEANRERYTVDLFGDKSILLGYSLGMFSKPMIERIEGLIEDEDWKEVMDLTTDQADRMLVEWNLTTPLSRAAVEDLGPGAQAFVIKRIFEHNAEQEALKNSKGSASKRSSRANRARSRRPGTATT